eukprot:6195971-Pleurochrysis_carterae.AAC.2
MQRAADESTVCLRHAMSTAKRVLRRECRNRRSSIALLLRAHYGLPCGHALLNVLRAQLPLATAEYQAAAMRARLWTDGAAAIAEIDVVATSIVSSVLAKRRQTMLVYKLKVRPRAAAAALVLFSFRLASREHRLVGDTG